MQEREEDSLVGLSNLEGVSKQRERQIFELFVWHSERLSLFLKRGAQEGEGKFISMSGLRMRDEHKKRRACLSGLGLK